MINNHNPLLLIDFYKATHHDQYPEGLTKLVSYFTPRTTRIDLDKVVFFGLQGFIQKYLIDYFNEYFFNKDLDEVIFEYKRILDNTLGVDSYNLNRIIKLHNLGYLPLEIKSLEEGTIVPVGIPVIEISNTHPDFAWLVNTIESLMSADLWHTIISATIGHEYRTIVNKYYNKTVENDIDPANALGDFSFRGQESLESATKSSAAFLLSFNNTATIPAIMYLEDYYNCNIKKEIVGKGAISTEHSVMCSNVAAGLTEKEYLKKLLTEIYPDKSFSAVVDGYDYWNIVDNIIPELKNEILNRDACFLVRGDSGDPVEITTNTVYKLWDTFGGTINSKGYKVLDNHVRVIYGDSITQKRLNKIYEELEKTGFASNNVVLGVGSFSMQCRQNDDGKLLPYTRDTFGFAVKATYGEINDEPIFIYKDPKTDCGIKKSQKGLCYVYKKENTIKYLDGLDRHKLSSLKENLLITNFKNSNLFNQISLSKIRNNLNSKEKYFIKLKDDLVNWIKEYFNKNASPDHKAIVGISGGKDSSVVAALCVEALGKDRVFGVLMPDGDQKDIEYAKLLVKYLGIKYSIINIKNATDTLLSSIKTIYTRILSDQTLINLPARIRMTTLYGIAQTINGRVANTCNYCEDYIGYSTRWGDSVGDFAPLANLLVSEVKEVGRVLNLPEKLIEKIPADGLSGKTDEDNLGFTYKQLEQYILNPNENTVPEETVTRIENLHNSNLFKLEPIPSFIKNK